MSDAVRDDLVDEIIHSIDNQIEELQKSKEKLLERKRKQLLNDLNISDGDFVSYFMIQRWAVVDCDYIEVEGYFIIKRTGDCLYMSDEILSYPKKDKRIMVVNKNKETYFRLLIPDAYNCVAYIEYRLSEMAEKLKFRKIELQ